MRMLARMACSVLLAALLSLQGAAQSTDFYQQLTVTATAGGLSATGQTKAFCRGTVELAPVRFTLNGATPTASFGQPANVGDQIVLGNVTDIRNFLVVASTSTSATVNMSCGTGGTPAASFVSSSPTTITTTPSVVAQAPTVVQQTATDRTGCSPISFTAAVNNTVTLTLTPPSGQYVYFCGLTLGLSNDATGTVASANLTFTSTNLGGWLWKFSDIGTANVTTQQTFFTSPRWLLRSQVAGTAVTIVSPAINLHAAYGINAAYYFAP